MRTRRILGALVGATMALTLAGAAFAFANNTALHQNTDVVWDDTGFQASAGECDGLNLDPGQVDWHFILNQTDGTFEAWGHFEFADAGVIEQASVAHGSGRDWYVVTGRDTLHGALTYTNGVTTGQFNLSHICVGPEATPSPTPTHRSRPPARSTRARRPPLATAWASSWAPSCSSPAA